jgi:hypothetical protein
MRRPTGYVTECVDVRTDEQVDGRVGKVVSAPLNNSSSCTDFIGRRKKKVLCHYFYFHSEFYCLEFGGAGRREVEKRPTRK